MGDREKGGNIMERYAHLLEHANKVPTRSKNESTLCLSKAISNEIPIEPAKNQQWGGKG